MRILLWTDSPWDRTAYGRQCRDLIAMFTANGHDVGVLAKHGLNGAAIKYKGTPIYPPHAHPLGIDAVAPTVKSFGADVVMSIYDVWAFPPNIGDFIPVPWLAYFPLDGAPVPKRAIQALSKADYVMSYTKWGHEQLQNVGIESAYTPPGFDVDLFKLGDKTAAREQLGIPPDVFLVLTVGANKGFPARKSWSESLAAFAMFAREKEDVMYYCHTSNVPRGERSGIIFKESIEALGIDKKRMVFPPQDVLYIGVDDEQMATVYQSADVLLLPSRAEGFGFPVAEAQLCGTPVITIEAHALNELTVNGVKITNTTPQWIPALEYFWTVPNVYEIAEKLEWYYRNQERDYFAEMSETGRQHFAENYSHTAVWENYWKPFIERVEVELW